ncbi:hypothetical protein H072_4035 [Dactylellina haptotyla CBS 200.50]|uniref:Uncharacterized protein n=1 Tax=Dactylellina haptotyla (strain CBS 200.50) TaxID=1284197 RepID=S8BR92_DACHA|nr:hypothetical protein H072_4035 [Dactylellina haptotyla CBS 200.50]
MSQLDLSGASAGNAVVDEIDHDDLCPICRHVLHRPVVTQCNHTLCESCMAEWAEVSVTSQMTIPLDEEPQDFSALNLQAKCPMCRTLTSARRSEEAEERVRERYPEEYNKRDEEYLADEETKDVSVQTLTVYIGNTAKEVRDIGDGRKMYDWEFFVKVSDQSVINEVEVLLHETFKQPRTVKRRAPYSIRREGWGTFTVRANVVLKAGYSWISSDAVDSRYAKRVSLPLEWTLSFEDGGSQARCRLKIKNERRRLR